MAKIYAFAKPEQVDLKVRFYCSLVDSDLATVNVGQSAPCDSTTKHSDNELYNTLPTIQINDPCPG